MRSSPAEGLRPSSSTISGSSLPASGRRFVAKLAVARQFPELGPEKSIREASWLIFERPAVWRGTFSPPLPPPPPFRCHLQAR